MHPWVKKYKQPLLWSAALAALYFMNPESDFTLCPLNLIGFKFCPGCGIGHAIHYALHFDFSSSFQHHYLGIPATVIILSFIFKSIYHIKQPTIQ